MKSIHILSILIISISCLFGNNCQAQEDIVQKKHGMLKGTAGIEPGYMFGPDLLNLYISGNLEYYMQERASVRGDIYFFIDTQGKTQTLTDNHAIYFGGAYHFTNKAIVDPYIGLQPGVHLSRIKYWNEIDQKMQQTPFKFIPVASVIGGVNFYVSRFFNFYASTRGVFGSFNGAGSPAAFPLHEWRVSFGLGFNIGLIK